MHNNINSIKSTMSYSCNNKSIYCNQLFQYYRYSNLSKLIGGYSFAHSTRSRNLLNCSWCSLDSFIGASTEAGSFNWTDATSGCDARPGDGSLKLSALRLARGIPSSVVLCVATSFSISLSTSISAIILSMMPKINGLHFLFDGCFLSIVKQRSRTTGVK